MTFVVQVQVGVWSNPEVIGKTEYALSVAVEVLAFYEERFDLSYPLPKLGLCSAVVWR